jgi:hypothetical protein
MSIESLTYDYLKFFTILYPLNFFLVYTFICIIATLIFIKAKKIIFNVKNFSEFFAENHKSILALWLGILVVIFFIFFVYFMKIQIGTQYL